jgi:hypothetical protein
VSKRLIVMLLAMIATIALAAQVTAAEAETENPLEPLVPPARRTGTGRLRGRARGLPERAA